MKKLASRGFTLVELMIVIAIIGILAAVLYPQMVGYFERARDSSRQGAINQVNTAIGVYYVDQNKYPGDTNSKCIDDIEDALTGTGAGDRYMKGSVPKDPRGNYGVSNCNGANQGGYGYKLVDTNGSDYAVAANMEIKANGNFDGNGWSGLSGTPDIVGKGSLPDTVTKGDWYFVVSSN